MGNFPDMDLSTPPAQFDAKLFSIGLPVPRFLGPLDRVHIIFLRIVLHQIEQGGGTEIHI